LRPDTEAKVKPDPADRRQAERFPVTADTTCSFASPVLEDIGPVRIRNISTDGIGLLMTHQMEEGTLLAVGLSNKAKNFSKMVLVRVIHVTPQQGGFLVGGSFEAPLTYDEFRTMVM
jgi:hypothetical protein